MPENNDYRMIRHDENVECVPCAICGVENEEVLFQARDKMLYHHQLAYPAVRCRQCGLVYLNPRPAPEKRAFFYSEDYPFKADKSAQPYEHYRPVIEFLTKGPPGRLLDVGTGNSPFLPLMKERGWEVMGTEIDADLVEHFRKEEHIQLFHGELEDAQYESESFDAVTIMGVLEHVPDPRRVLEEAARIIKPGGVLCLWCFNRGFETKILGRFWPGFDAPRHFYSFSYKTMDHLLRETGFEVVGNYFRPLSYFFYTGIWAAKRVRNRLRHNKRATYVLRMPLPLELAGRFLGTALAKRKSSSNMYIFARKVTPVRK